MTSRTGLVFDRWWAPARAPAAILSGEKEGGGMGLIRVNYPDTPFRLLD